MSHFTHMKAQREKRQLQHEDRLRYYANHWLPLKRQHSQQQTEQQWQQNDGRRGCESWYTCQWVTSLMPMSHVTHECAAMYILNCPWGRSTRRSSSSTEQRRQQHNERKGYETRHTCELVTSHVSRRHVTHLNVLLCISSIAREEEMTWGHSDECAAAQPRVVCACARTCVREQKEVCVGARGQWRRVAVMKAKQMEWGYGDACAAAQPRAVCVYVCSHTCVREQKGVCVGERRQWHRVTVDVH